MSVKKFHPAGDVTCSSCYHGYPKPCESPGCKGLTHAVFGGNEDGLSLIWLYTGCDVCDRRESVIPERAGEITVVTHVQCRERSRSMVVQGVV